MSARPSARVRPWELVRSPRASARARAVVRALVLATAGATSLATRVAAGGELASVDVAPPPFARPALTAAVTTQMPAQNGIPRKDDPPLATDDAPAAWPHLAEDLAERIAVRDLADERFDDDTGDPVGLHAGLVSVREVDLHLAGRGFDLDFARRYVSHLAPVRGPLGHGWQHSCDVRLEMSGPYADLWNGNGRVDRYTRVDAATFAPPPGVYARLALDPTNGTWVLRTRRGMRTTFAAIPGDAPTTWRATRIADRHGNHQDFVYSTGGRLEAVVDTVGHRLEFAYDAAGGLARVRDVLGREVHYERDAAGDLVRVRTAAITSTGGLADAPNGHETRYAYLAGPVHLSHRLASVVRPSQVADASLVPVVRFEYEASPASPFVGWVRAQHAPGGSIGYAYEVVNPLAPPGPGLARVATTVTDRRGALTRYEFDEGGHALAIRERLDDGTWAVTTFAYDGDGEVTRVVRPEGDEERRTYRGGTSVFARGDLVRIERHRGPRAAAQDVLATTFAYEPVFGHPLEFVDERGAATRWLVDWMEGGAGPAGGYDVLDAIASELGVPLAEAAALATPLLRATDLNGDGPRALVRGDLVARIEPVATSTALGGAPQAAACGTAAPLPVRSATYDAYGRVTSETDPEENVSVFLYTPASDLDGDGVVDPDVPASSDTRTGGWLARVVEDASLPFADPELAGVLPRALPTDLGRDRGACPAAAPVARTTDLVHDRVGRVRARVDPRGVRTTFAVDERDRVWRVVDGADVAAAQARGGACDGSHEDLAPVAPRETRFLHDPDDRILARFESRTGEPDGGAWPGWRETWWAYDVAGAMTAEAREVGPAGELAVRTFGRDAAGAVVVAADADGRVQRIERDARGHVVGHIRAAGTPAAATERWRRDANGDVVEHVDALGHVTRWTRDGFGRVVEITRADGSSRRVEWDAGSNPVGLLDRGVAGDVGSAIVDLRRVETTYDERGRLVRIDRIDPRTPLVDGALVPGDGRVTTIREHDRLGRVTFTIDDDGRVTAAAWDGLSRPVFERDAAGNTRTRCFDDASNEVEVWTSVRRSVGAPRVALERARFDAFGRCTARTDAAGNTETWEHGADDAPRSHRDPLGNRSTFTYDGAGRLVHVARELRVGGDGSGALDVGPDVPDGVVDVAFAYDGGGRLVEARDDAGRATRFEYDALGHRSAVIRPSGRRVVETRDALGGLVAHEDARGDRLVLARDPLGRPTSIDRVVRAPGTRGSAALRFAYDGLGRRTRSVDSVGDVLGDGDDAVVVRSYDALGRLVRDAQDGRAVDSTWRGDGRRVRVAYPSGLVVDLEHDELDRPTARRQGTFLLFRDAHVGPRDASARIERVAANGLRAALEDGAAPGLAPSGLLAASAPANVAGAIVGPLGRPARLDVDRGGAVVATLEASYDAAGRRTLVRRAPPSVEDRATYDSLGRLVRLEHGAPASSVPTAGAPAHPGSVEAWTRDGSNHATSTTRDGHVTRVRTDVDGAPTVFGAERPVHDADGNTIVVDARAVVPIVLEYDAFSRLRALSRGPVRIEHDYDAEGRRVRTRRSVAGGATSTRTYVHDGWDEIEERDGTGAVVLRTLHGSVDDPVRVEGLAGGALTLFGDLDGHVAFVTDATGALVERVEYDAYGSPRFQGASDADAGRATSSVGLPFLFAGRRFEHEIVPLVDLRARMLSPRHAAFLQRDPLGEWADLANLGDAYVFAAADPWNRRDPFGLEGSAPEWVHETLSWVGFVPGFGVGADLVDASLYALDGAWWEAAQSGVAAIPLLGDAYAGGRKLGRAATLAAGVVGGVDDLRRTKDLRKVGRDVVDELERIGEHPHRLKKGAGGSTADIFVDREGELYRGNKSGTGFAERLWINLKELFE